MSSSNQGQMVQLGENTEISMQVLQDVYKEFTGRTEKLTKRVSVDHKTAINDIVQLNTKLEQAFEQYNIINKNCLVTVFHEDDSTERFSSFQRFKIYDGSSLSPIHNIRLKYCFLILLPKAQKAQPYELEIDIHSRAAMLESAKDESGFTRHLLSTAAKHTGVIEIDYVDYTVAKNFMNIVEGWFKGLQQSKEGTIISFLTKQSEHYPFYFKYLSATFLSVWFFNYLNYKELINFQNEELFKTGLIAFGMIFIVSGIAMKLGAVVSNVLEFRMPSSYLKLNRGDEILISNQNSRIFWSYTKAIVSALFVIILNMTSTYLANQIGL